MKNSRSIREEELIWDEFERCFKEIYLSERYYDDRAKEFYKLRMGSMKDDEYTSIFLELLRYVSYLKDEKVKIQRFISGLPKEFRDHIDFDEPQSFEEAIRKLKHCYEYLKHKSKPKHVWKVNKYTKGKWPQKQGRFQDAGEKDNVAPYKKFNAVEKAHRSQLGKN